MFGRMGAAELSESAGWAIDPRVEEWVYDNARALRSLEELEMATDIAFTGTFSTT